MDYRNTKQRQKILQVLESTTSHPTANWVYSQIVDDFPNISLGTVYRNLSVLEEQGMIKKLSCGSTYDRYDANTTPHIHIACTKCGKVADLHNETALNKLKDCIDVLDSDIDYYELTCYHVCDECKKIDASH